MPQGLLTGGMPLQLSGNTYNQIEQIENYLFQLMEELRYTFSHIDPDNYTENGLRDMTKVITGGLTLRVENGEESSVVKLESNGMEIGSKEIKFTGLAKFLKADDLGENGETVIDGGRIQTGQITAITFDGCTFKTTLSADGKVGGEIEAYYGEGLAGGFRLDASGAGTETEQKHRLFLYSKEVDGQPFALKLQSAAGCSIEAAQSLYFKAGGGITITTLGEINLWGTVKINGQTIGG